MADAACIVEAAGADILDLNFGWPVPKITKAGAGATVVEEPGRACEIVSAAVEAVNIPVMVKMRLGLSEGSRFALDVGPRVVAAGASALTLHPRSAAQMYTGQADHSLTAELVQLVGVPVIASGDITSRARAQQVIDETGSAAVMVGRAAQGNPWALAEIAGDSIGLPSGEDVVIELVLFMRETVRDLEAERAAGFLRKFYGWYLGHGRFPRQLKHEVVSIATAAETEARLLAATPGAAKAVTERSATIGATDERPLELPISIDGGGWV